MQTMKNKIKLTTDDEHLVTYIYMISPEFNAFSESQQTLASSTSMHMSK